MDRFRGKPVIDGSKCVPNCRICEQVCPTKAIAEKNGKKQFDLGRCIFCPDCFQACPNKAIDYAKDYRLSAAKRTDLLVDAGATQVASDNSIRDKRIYNLFRRSLKLRQVSAGGCNACEMDTNVLNTIAFDLGRFGIQFVASPCHADGLLVTGPVTENMKKALEKTYAAVPAPKIVIAVGACAISGGPYSDHTAACNGIESVIPVDLFVPGCPPHPLSILDAVFGLANRLIYCTKQEHCCRTSAPS